MNSFDRQQVEHELQKFVGDKVYVHSEATSYVFVRNFRINLREARVAGGERGSFRVAFRFDEQGWLRMEGLTHYEVDSEGHLLLAGYDDHGRMDVALHLGREAFPE